MVQGRWKSPINWLTKLGSMPDISSALWRLFVACREVNEQRFFLCLHDVTREYICGKPHLVIDFRRLWMMQEFRDFLVHVLIGPGRVLSLRDRKFITRLQLVTYGHFWESTWVQRLFLMLACIASGERYDPQVLSPGQEKSCRSVYEKVISKTRSSAPELSAIIDTIYVPQVRNSVSHCKFWCTDEFVILENHKPDDTRSIPSISYKSWAVMFTATLRLVECLVRFSGDFLAIYRTKQSFIFDVPEFAGPFRIVPDPRGGWRITDP